MTASPTRVVAVFDPATGTPAAMDTAAALAARLGARLLVLWLDDDRLRALAALPFLRHVAPGAGSAEVLEQGIHDAAVRVLAERVRRSMGEAARRHDVVATFETAHGSVLDHAAQAGAQGDLLVVEGASRPLPGGARLPSHARATVERANRPVMLLPHRADLSTGNVQVVREPGGERTLRAASELARRLGIALEEIAVDQLEGALCRAPGGVIVLGATSRWLTSPDAWELLAAARCAAWIVK